MGKGNRNKEGPSFPYYSSVVNLGKTVKCECKILHEPLSITLMLFQNIPENIGKHFSDYKYNNI